MAERRGETTAHAPARFAGRWPSGAAPQGPGANDRGPDRGPAEVEAVRRARDDGRAYVIVVNWNGWEDTVECLESVMRSDHPSYQVVVVDNGSCDGSIERLVGWAEGRETLPTGERGALRDLTEPPVPKPIPYARYSATAELGRDAAASDARVVFITTDRNLGFAGGNNVALRYVQSRGDANYVWLLNNDTVVRPDALRLMTARLAEEPEAGLCGCTVLDYHRPEIVQAMGGFTYNPWFGTSRRIGESRTWGDLPAAEPVEREMFGVYGASVVVTERFIRDVGLLSESYFLYFEEQDWAARARRAGFRQLYAPAALVYHREGASTGGRNGSTASRSRLSDYHALRSRLVFTRRFYPAALPTVYLGLLAAALNRARRRQLDRVPMILALAGAFLLGRDGTE